MARLVLRLVVLAALFAVMELGSVAIHGHHSDLWRGLFQ